MAKIWKTYNLAYYSKHPTAPGSFVSSSRLVDEGSKRQPGKEEGQQLLPAPLFPAPDMTSVKDGSISSHSSDSALPDNRAIPNPVPAANSAPLPAPSPAPAALPQNPSQAPGHEDTLHRLRLPSPEFAPVSDKGAAGVMAPSPDHGGGGAATVPDPRQGAANYR